MAGQIFNFFNILPFFYLLNLALSYPLVLACVCVGVGVGEILTVF